MDFRRLFSDAMASAGRVLILALSNILLISVITRWLGEGAYGIWTTIIAFTTLMSIIFGLHLHGSLIRFSQNKKSNQVFIDLLTIGTLIAITTTILVVISGTILFPYLPIDDIPANALLPVACLIGAQILTKLLLSYYRANRQVKLFEFLTAGRRVFEIAVLIVAFWLTQDLVAALWAFVGVTAVINTALAILTIPKNLTTPDPANFLEYFDYGFPMIHKELAGILLEHTDKFLVIAFIGPVATGIYSVAYTVTSILPMIAGVFNSTLYPNVSAAYDDGNFEELSEFYNTFLRWYSILALPSVVGFIFLSAPILRLVSTTSIVERGTVLIPILAVGFVVQGLESVLSYPLAAGKETKRIAGVTTLAVIMNIILNLILIPTIGLIGAAIATTVSYSARSGILYIYTKTHIDINIQYRPILKSGVGTGIMTIVLFAIPTNNWLIKLIFYPIIGATAFITIFVAIGGLRQQEIESLRRIID